MAVFEDLRATGDVLARVWCQYVTLAITIIFFVFLLTTQMVLKYVLEPLTSSSTSVALCLSSVEGLVYRAYVIVLALQEEIEV